MVLLFPVVLLEIGSAGLTQGLKESRFIAACDLIGVFEEDIYGDADERVRGDSRSGLPPAGAGEAAFEQGQCCELVGTQSAFFALEVVIVFKRFCDFWNVLFRCRGVLDGLFDFTLRLSNFQTYRLCNFGSRRRLLLYRLTQETCQPARLTTHGAPRPKRGGSLRRLRTNSGLWRGESVSHRSRCVRGFCTLERTR